MGSATGRSVTVAKASTEWERKGAQKKDISLGHQAMGGLAVLDLSGSYNPRRMLLRVQRELSLSRHLGAPITAAGVVGT